MPQFVIEPYRTVTIADIGKNRLTIRKRVHRFADPAQLISEGDIGKRLITIDAPNGRYLAMSLPVREA